jgi:hypothetical protein
MFEVIGIFAVVYGSVRVVTNLPAAWDIPVEGIPNQFVHVIVTDVPLAITHMPHAIGCAHHVHTIADVYHGERCKPNFAFRRYAQHCVIEAQRPPLHVCHWNCPFGRPRIVAIVGCIPCVLKVVILILGPFKPVYPVKIIRIFVVVTHEVTLMSSLRKCVVIDIR